MVKTYQKVPSAPFSEDPTEDIPHNLLAVHLRWPSSGKISELSEYVQRLCMSLKALGSDCSTAVVHTPRNYEVMSSLLFLSLTLSLSGASLIRSLEEVQHH